MNFLRRCVAYWIDMFLLCAALMVYMSFNGTPSKSGTGYTPTNLELFCIVAGWYTYFLFFETNFSTTPGKFIFKLRVIKLDGSKPGIFDILRRRLFDILELIMVSIIAPIMVLATDREQRLGDLIAKTTVIRK